MNGTATPWPRAALGALLALGIALPGEAGAQSSAPSTSGRPAEATLRLRGRKLDTRASLYPGSADLAASGWDHRDRELRQLGLETVEASMPEIFDPEVLRARALALHGGAEVESATVARTPLEPRSFATASELDAPAPARFGVVTGGLVAFAGALLLLAARRKRRLARSSEQP